MGAGERIYEAVARDGSTAALRGEAVARRIERDIAQNRLSAGESLGSLRELAARYGVGRSAASEAVRILERRGLGRMRSGRAGGLVLAKPDREAVALELADFFRLVGLSLRQLMDARQAVDAAAARLAAERTPSASEAARLAQLQAEGGLAGELALRSECARLSGDPAIQLFVACLNRLTLDLASPGLRISVRGARAAPLAEALTRGDADAAADAVCAGLPALQAALASAARPAGPPCPAPGGPAASHRSDEVVAALEADLLNRRETGARLGSEWELCERYGAGRLALRQAIRMLEDRGLVASQRGRGHGLVAREPQPFGAVRQAVAWLMSERFDVMGVGRLLCLLNVATPAQAVARADDAGRARLRMLLARQEGKERIDRADTLELVRCVAELADAPLVDVFCRSLVAYEACFRSDLPETFSSDTQRPYQQLLRRLLDAWPWSEEAAGRLKAETAALMLAYSRCAPP